MGHHRFIVSIDVTVAQVPAPPSAATPPPAATPPASTGIGDELGQDLSGKVKPIKLKKPANQKDYQIKDVVVTKVVVVP